MNRSILIALVLTIFIFGCTGLTGSQPILNYSLNVSDSACVGTISYGVSLKNLDGQPLNDQPISFYVNTDLVDVVRTTRSGEATTNIPIKSVWCGKPISLVALFKGNLFNKQAIANETRTIKIPTNLIVKASTNATVNDSFKILTRLTDAVSNAPISGKTILAIGKDAKGNAITNSAGEAEISITYTSAGKDTLSVLFEGNSVYSASPSSLYSIIISQKGCNDGTPTNSCSLFRPSYFCNASSALVSNCAVCGCGSGLYCIANACVTTEQRTSSVIDNAQKNVVLVQSDSGTGSGVILSYNGKSVVLTNRHVVDPDFDYNGVYNLFVKTFDQRSLIPSEVYLSPTLDLAVLTFSTNVGDPAVIDYNYTAAIGDDLLVLGSPYGLQYSVSKGIVSNYLRIPEEGNANYVQTDAAVNPGNSGGGMFLLRNGNLIGINTFGLKKDPSGTPLEGLNFAIDAKYFDFSPDTWAILTPAPRCIDGTAYGKCSTKNIGLSCNSGDLIKQCSICGCPSKSGYKSYCLNEACSYCTNSEDAFKGPDNKLYCCPAGRILYCSNSNCFCR